MASRLRDLIAFLSSVQGDLTNITAPPAFLAPSSVVEVGHCWAQRPAAFAAPSFESDPARRSLLVLRLVLLALRSQLYIGGQPGKVGIKKPLNPFLGELFLGSWTDAERKCGTKLVAEQVSHHPPVTAMHISDSEHGVRADGYARVEMTFSPTSGADIRQVGHAVLRVERYAEDYLIPLPDVKVRGFWGGRLYPEVIGTYRVVGSNGYVSEICFTGESGGLLGGRKQGSGKKNAFTARTWHESDENKESIYTASGVWSEGWTVVDARTGEELDVFDAENPDVCDTALPMDPLLRDEEMDPWESRRAWAGVLDALREGDIRKVSAEKSRVEQAQREMRKKELRGELPAWEPLFFRRVEERRASCSTSSSLTASSSNSSNVSSNGSINSSNSSRSNSSIRGKGLSVDDIISVADSEAEDGPHELFRKLSTGHNWQLHEDKTQGVWRVDESKVAERQRPFRGSLTPLG